MIKAFSSFPPLASTTSLPSLLRKRFSEGGGSPAVQVGQLPPQLPGGSQSKGGPLCRRRRISLEGRGRVCVGVIHGGKARSLIPRTAVT